jgi:predicted nucleic acid-binding protein
MFRSRPDAARRLLGSFDVDGLPRFVPLNESDLPGIARILAVYANIRPQLADAALVHLAEWEGLNTIFTLDRRDFTVYRLSRNRSLHLIP